MHITHVKQMSDYTFVLWGFVMHLILLWGVMDVNFHSPIIQGLPIVPLPEGAPAKRVFLFVADGLRFRTFIQNIPPYLRSIINGKGVWAKSHTRVPTESRPGNIAIVAGFYEDPSALFKGWKENPVDFDSVLNQTRITWAWGSPDIVSIFTKGSDTNVHGESYSSSWQDFDKSTIRLDSWVFDRFSKWLNNEALEVKDQDKILLYFHLLGCDTAGHASKPNSREYIENIKYVDQKIEEVVQMTENYFRAGSTAYIFTSDHGMTDWGSHGSGSLDETETPFVAWGAGLATNSEMNNIEQADITPLISVLLGIPIPVNNEGILPREFLNFGNPKYEAQALLSNLKQLVFLVEANRVLSIGNSTTSTHWLEQELYKKLHEIEQLLDKGEIEESVKESQAAILSAKEALFYFRGYFRTLYLMYLTLMWLGWITVLFLKISGKPRDNISSFYFLLNNVLYIITILVLTIEHQSYQDFRWLGYGTMAVVSSWLALRCLITIAPKIETKLTLNSSFTLIGIVLLLTTMYFGLTYRWFFTVGMLLAVAMQRFSLKDCHPLLTWTGLALSVFPVLPVVEPHPRIYIVLTSLFIAIFYIASKRELKLHLKYMICARLIVTAAVCMEYIDGRRWSSWMILGSTPFFIWMHPTNLRERLEAIVLHMLCPLALLSASYETLFYLVLAVHLLCWPLPTCLERKSEIVAKNLNLEDLMKASFLMLYTLLCFFGTGNMASLSSFDPKWTHHFVTVFSPFTMTALILLKIAIPLILVGCICRALASTKTYLGVLFLGDCLALFLMYGVTSQGSWLDIGSAISRFTIAIALPCLSLLLHYLSYPLMVINYKRYTVGILEKYHQV